MKYFFVTLFLTGSLISVNAQSVTISVDQQSKGHNTSQFLVNGKSITISNDTPNFESAAVTSNVAKSGLAIALSGAEVNHYDVNGDILQQSDYNVMKDDNSVKLFLSNNGRFAIRENIANFLFYDTYGNLQQSISNSSQSPDGESISEFAADPAFKTIVLYNPKIIRGTQEGSRARVVKRNGTTTDILNDSERSIRFVEVSGNGQYIGITSYSGGAEDEVLVTDRFGNEINSIPFDQSVSGIQLTDDGKFITIYSNSRAAAYNLISGERVGSTSFRSPLQIAKYFPQDQTIIALTADKSASTLSNVEIHAVNVAARAIERKEYNSNLGITDLFPVEIKRDGSNQYSISGISRPLHIRASF